MSWCECGNEKKRSRQVCDRCADLDGPIKSIDVMNELRASDGGATIYEIAAGTGRSTRSVVRTLRGWLKEGRVLRLMDGEDGDERGGCEAAVWRLA